jgi:hypothetical protein
MGEAARVLLLARLGQCALDAVLTVVALLLGGHRSIG